MLYLHGEDRPHYAVREWGGQRRTLTRWTVDKAEAMRWLALFPAAIEYDENGIAQKLPAAGECGVVLAVEWMGWSPSPAQWLADPEVRRWTATAAPSVPPSTK